MPDTAPRLQPPHPIARAGNPYPLVLLGLVTERKVVPGVVSASVAETMVIAGRVATVMWVVSVSVAESVVMARRVSVVVVMGIGWRLACRGRCAGATRKEQTKGQ